jgi:hypothetical protein
MDPLRKYTLTRNMMQAIEKRDAAIIRAERDCTDALRQLLDQAMAVDLPTAEEPKP